MTARSVILGLLGAALLGAVTYFNDEVIKGPALIGNFLPVSVFGGLLLLALAVNPLLMRVGRRRILSARELAVATAITLFACYVPGRGLMHYFTNFLMLPHHFERTSPGWRGEPAAIEADQVLDWGRFAAALAGDGPRAGGLPGRFCGRLPPEPAHDSPAGAGDPERRAAWLAAVNAALADPALREGLPVPRDAAEWVKLLARRAPEALTAEEHAALNRGLLDAALPGVLRPRKPAVLENAPARMLADARADPAVALDGFVAGLAPGERRISPRQVPWGAWRDALLFWMPLILTMCAAVSGLALVVHRQWSSHEHLPYPTVEFARTVLPEEGRTIGEVFRRRAFWWGAGAVFAIHMVNYANSWWPDYVIPITTRLDLTPVADIFPVFKKGSWWNIFNPRLFFTVIGFAYFLACDVSLSLGIAPYAFCLAMGTAAGYGVTFGFGHLKPTISSFLYAGGYTGMFLVLAYSGRRYFGSVFARSLGLRAGDRVERHAVWGARVFILGVALLVLQLAAVGVDAQVATLYVLLAAMIFLVMSRLLAEAGVFFLHPYFSPCGLLWGWMGAMALGRGQLLVLSMVSTLLLIDPREAMMPFAVSGLQLVERVRGRLGRAAAWGLAALALAFVISVPVVLYWDYQYGAFRVGDSWTLQNVPRFAFDLNAEIARTLEAQGSLALSQGLHGWERFRHVVPNPTLAAAFLTTFSLVLLFSFLRHRFARWPLHPLLFLVLGTWQSQTLGFSFFVGWLVKSLVSRYGGAALYQRLKPLMVGLVAGEVFAALVPVIVGAVYYGVTGKPPNPFQVLGV